MSQQTQPGRKAWNNSGKLDSVYAKSPNNLDEVCMYEGLPQQQGERTGDRASRQKAQPPSSTSFSSVLPQEGAGFKVDLRVSDNLLTRKPVTGTPGSLWSYLILVQSS